ncbi:hypothetical protein LTR36_007847 [Oleoguttula mirabilis]|uniref:Transcription factor SipA3 n=1 Tax=Oleoguttula mirabilis TaxID=1507867 RepID=A0AAV9J9Z5_9PEZI|nr:hypothetical protein LTR36_007847 [Oleoguttula mirabilis]
MADEALPTAVQHAERVERPLNLIPVGLKEAALDSPTFRATALHFSDQIEVIERWLDGYVKAASKLVAEVSSLESLVNSFLSQSMPPAQVSEAVLDHDYTMLAMRRYGEGAREFWQSTLRGVKKYDTTVVDPIKSFLNTELKSFKEARSGLQATQKAFDHVISRYLSQGKTKEASSLREDAFQLHEARKAYLKASMDFCIAAPQLRSTLDKLLVRIFAEQWKEMRAAGEANSSMFAKASKEMERVRGWSREMENSERAFKRELMTARRQIEESASTMMRPSRELEDYAASTVPYLGSGAGGATGMSSDSKPAHEKREKQGWLFIKSVTGKPARTVWSRRWFFVKNGIFGWLVQGARSGGVEESEKIGVLLCSVRPAFQEERRFCFEIKTKDTSIILQAETQAELTEWIGAFEVAKRKALEDPASSELGPLGRGIDPAFAVTPPVAPEFAAKIGDSHPADEPAPALSVPEREGTISSVASHASFDVAAPAARRIMSLEKLEGEGSREHAARIIQKLDLHKRIPTSPQQSQAPAAGGIASLISASHNILPVGPGAPSTPSSAESGNSARRIFTMPTSSLAPSTLANPPAPTNLSHTAVIVSSERGIGLGRGADGSGMPSGIMANLWGSSNWGYVNRIGEESAQQRLASQPVGSPIGTSSVTQDDLGIMDGMGETSKAVVPLPIDLLGGGLRHRKTVSIANDGPLSGTTPATLGESDEYPNYYPLPLKAQQAQFGMLFPSVPRSEKVVLVFRATWNPNEQQEFPGRVYVTEKEVYFYSNHLGLVLITSISLGGIREVTAAPGRDCDFVYLHLKERADQQDDFRRVTVKVFLEPLRLLQRRLSFLVRNASAEQPASLEEVLKALIKMEIEQPQRSSSVESWEDATFDGDSPPATAGDQQRSPGRKERNVKASLRIDGTLYGDPVRTGREVQKFKLPAQPVVYAPQGMQASVTRDFNVSAKALFHVMFGDKSAVFQLLYYNRWADKIAQTAWTKTAEQNDGHWTRQFASPGQATPLADTQTIDILNDHLCYVVTNTKSPWRLPYATRFMPITKIIITHTAKSRCKLAVFQHINWLKAPKWPYVQRLIEMQAINTLEADALDLTNVAMDQVAKLGSHSKTNRAVEIFGNVGQQTQAPLIDASAMTNLGGTGAAAGLKQRKAVGLPRLVVNDVLARLLGLVSMAFGVLVALGKAVVSVCTAHTLLVAMLAISMVYNSWYGYREGLSWYHERSAGRFMTRLGVTPNPAMSKSIYLTDIDELVAPTNFNHTLAAMIPAGSARTCKTTFSELVSSTDSSLGPPHRQGARLHRTRDALALYRHDLLVALRVVNRVESDVVSAEWEEWVRAEEQKCARVEQMLREKRPSKGKGKQSVLPAAEVDAELGDDFAEYCRSCRIELDEIGNGTSVI